MTTYPEEKPPNYNEYAHATAPPPANNQNSANNVNRWNDVESQNPNQAADGQWGTFGQGLTEKVVRLKFIRKVYSIVTIQLIFTFTIVLIFTAVDAIRNWMTKTTGGLILYILA